MTMRKDHKQDGRAPGPGPGPVVRTGGDHDDNGAGEHAARHSAEALIRIARAATPVAQDGQALAEDAARAASQRQLTAAVVGASAERAQHRAEARQQVAEDAQHRVMKNQHVAEETQRTTAASLRLRTETFAAVAHDLRQPLTSLVARADLAHTRLADSVDLNPDRAWLTAQLAAVQAAATRLRRATDDLDDVVQLAAGGELPLRWEPVDVGALARAVAEEFALQRTVLVEAPAAPVFVRGDYDRLDRVLQNLVGNALKYSEPETPVRVTVTQGAAAVIAVHDRGRGIPAAETPHIFERAYRASTARGTAGSGLGLAGAPALMARHGGHITVESAEGVGTTITLTLPLAPPPA